MRSIISVMAILWVGFFSLLPASAQSATATSAQAPVVRAVLFRADWCVNCHVLEPELEKAMGDAVGLPVELVVLDFTNPQKWDQSIEVALDHNVVQVYNAYAGITGLVVLTAADTGERIDCFNRTFSAPAMVHAMKQAVSVSLSAPKGSRSRASAFCPTGRAPL